MTEADRSRADRVRVFLVEAIGERVKWLDAEANNSKAYHDACADLANLGRALDAVTRALS